MDSKKVLNKKLIAAIESADTKRVGELIAQGADPNARTSKGGIVWHHAFVAANPSHEVVSTLLSNGADANVKDAQGETAILYAAAMDTPNTGIIISQLATAGADMNVRDKHGNTPLHMAASLFHYGPAAKLLQEGANPSLKDGADRTPKDIYLEYVDRLFSTKPLATELETDGFFEREKMRRSSKNESRSRD